MGFQQFGDESAHIRLNAGDSLQAGDGNDTISLPSGGGNLVSIGSGNNLLFGGADEDTIALGKGRNVIELNQGIFDDVHLTAGDGTNSVAVLVAEASNDAFVFGQGNNSFSCSTALIGSSLVMGDGVDTVSFTSAAAPMVGSAIRLGNGSDLLTAGAVLIGDQFMLGDGNDSVALLGITNPLPHQGDSFTLGDGNDSLEIESNLAADRVMLGNGDDSLNIVGLSVAESSFLLGNGSDSLAASGTDLSGTQISFGDGADSLSLQSTGGAVTLIGGEGGDSLSVANSTLRGAEIIFGNGADHLAFSATSGTASIGVGQGDDLVSLRFASLATTTLTMGNGADGVQLFSTTGDLTINAGSGTDTFQVLAVSGGALTINRPFGSAASIFDFTGSPSVTGTIAITNQADVIFNAPAGLTMDVAVDGYKAPYTGIVQYVSTGAAIAASFDTAQSLPYFLSGLLFSPAPHQTATIGAHATPPSFTFSIMQRPPSYASTFDRAGFQTIGPDLPQTILGMSPKQILDANAQHLITLNAPELSVVTALADWQSVANIQFVAAADSDSIQFRFGSNNQGLASAAYSYVPLVPASYFTAADQRNSETADVYFNSSAGGLNFAPNGFGGLAAAHEIGHGLGLGGESGDGDGHDTIPFGEDTDSFTVMSHHNGAINGGFPIAPQVFDLAAAQYLYGPNPYYHPNPSHVWGFNAAGGTGNLVSDGSGFVDSISAGFTAQNAYIDLRPGHWDYLGHQRPDILAPNQLMIDYGTTIQVATGGFGDDTLVGNGVDDSLSGGGGNDLFVVGWGNETIDGGSGSNTALFADASGDYSIDNAGGVTSVSELLPGRQGHVVLTNVELLQFSDRAVMLAGGAPELPSPSLLGDGDNLLIGKGPADTIVGGNGSDSIAVSEGNDLVVSAGSDPMATGADADTIVAGDGNDTIMGGDGAGSITVGDGNDLVYLHDPSAGGFGGTRLQLGAGADTVFAVGGQDTILGGGGAELLAGGAGAVSIVGGAGLTVMTGGAGASTLTAGTGAARIVGLSGHDSIAGGSGGDTIIAAGGDSVRAGAGKDFITFGPGNATVATDLGKGAVSIELGAFSADGQQKSVTIGGGAATLSLSDPAGAVFAPTGVIKVTGYKPGIDHFLLRGLGEHNFAAISLQTVNGNATITIGDVGTVQLVGVTANAIGSADFTFA